MTLMVAALFAIGVRVCLAAALSALCRCFRLPTSPLDLLLRYAILPQLRCSHVQAR
jgi:hypothetical protein